MPDAHHLIGQEQDEEKWEHKTGLRSQGASSVGRRSGDSLPVMHTS